MDQNSKLKPKMATSNKRQNTEDALKRYVEQQSRIHIDVREDGVLVLDGQVDSWEELQAIELAAASVPGVGKIEDRIKIA
jgi:osmotically-inducible protein OsmY